MKSKAWYESKVLWVAVAQGLVGVIVALQSSEVQVAGWVLIIKSGLDIYLRLGTNKLIK